MHNKFLAACITALLLATGLPVQAQQLSPQTISSGGSSKNTGNILLEDALGGLLVSSISNPNVLYTQDFLQPVAGTTNVPPVINNVVLGSSAGIDNAGTTFINASAMLEFTLGEFAAITFVQGNAITTQGILQPYANAGALPVTGLEFYARRLNSRQVQLAWKTLQEINNKGFHVERRRENESAFTELGFINSKAASGNSSLPLNYEMTDENQFIGNTYYRLKQEDMDGKTRYSVIQLVKGNADEQPVMKIWPLPAVGYFNLSVTGLSKPAQAQVFDMAGRLMKQFIVQDQLTQQVNGLPPGTYIITLADDHKTMQKAVIQ